MVDMVEEGSHAEDVLRQFGLVLRAHRRAAGLSQEGLAHRSGLDRSYIGQVERGERNIALVNIVRLASALGAEPATLLKGVSANGVADVADHL